MIEERFWEFLTEYKGTVLSELKTKNEEYKRLSGERRTHREKILELTNGEPLLSSLVDSHSECTYLVHDIESDMMYLQGVQDAIKMLRLINVI